MAPVGLVGPAGDGAAPPAPHTAPADDSPNLANIVMAYIVMAYIVMADDSPNLANGA